MLTNQPKVFDHEMFGSIQIVTIEGKEMFGATQVALALGYKDPNSAVRQHCKSEGAVIHPVLTSGGTQQMKFISEGNVYRLIARSKLPGAEAFEKWVFDEVLPSIRENGMFATDSLLDDPDLLLKTVTKLTEERRARVEAEQRAALLQTETEIQAEIIEEQAEELVYLDEVIRPDGTLTVLQIASDYSMSAQRLNNILNGERVQRKSRKQWLLYEKYKTKEVKGERIVRSVTSPYTNPKTGLKETATKTEWTQAGRMFIHELLLERGYIRETDAGFVDTRKLPPCPTAKQRKPAEVIEFPRQSTKETYVPYRPKLTLNLRPEAQ
ncbi:phage antirepressor KilAC domain-containing protein [Paenibacillus sp. ACRRY]|uniref:phage antirepressor n=1 Tax=Paenibacillus sp. ACRRY TaxID=2918208 RepID=UPI001EF5F575|nr:phage antirepressor KilAC domain-containing protein [Paenibacillus sp. ACRRY]MCG7386843.1 phage antirepressor KilAC domain-containing protein [Paenibacillus sp. ACRRY]